MSKGYNPKQCCFYEWSFDKAHPRHQRTSEGTSAPPTSTQLPSISSVHSMAASTSHPLHSDAHQHIPYSGSTLWNPRLQRKTPDKFLTLTPLRPHQKPADSSSSSSLPVISITPRRRASREFSFFEDFKDSVAINSYDSHNSSKTKTTDLHNIISTDYDVMKNIGLSSLQRKNKSERISIFPDVYAVVRSHRRTEKNNAKCFRSDKASNRDLSYSNALGAPGMHAAEYSRSSDIECVPLPSLGKPSDKNSSTFSLTDKNIQDQGTIFSRQNNAFYDRLAREPTVLIPPPVGFRYVFPKDVKRANPEGNSEANKESSWSNESKPQSSASQIQSQYRRSRLKDRRSYIRWNAHRAKSKKTEDSECESGGGGGGNGVQTDGLLIPSTLATGKTGRDEISRAIYNSLQSAPRGDVLPGDGMTRRGAGKGDEYESSYTTGRRTTTAAAAQFCDVLGQKSCQRCREFHTKNFQQPPKETATAATVRIRANSPVTMVVRENSAVAPTVGLQKVVIRIKDEHGRLEIAAEEINKQLL